MLTIIHWDGWADKTLLSLPHSLTHSRNEKKDISAQEIPKKCLIVGKYLLLLKWSFAKKNPTQGLVYNRVRVKIMRCISPLMWWARIPLMWGVLDTTLCDKVGQILAAGWWSSPVSSTDKTYNNVSTIILTLTSNPKTYLRQINFTVPYTKCQCNLNLCKPIPCFNWTICFSSKA
jgi:hypothetical protein